MTAAPSTIDRLELLRQSSKTSTGSPSPEPVGSRIDMIRQSVLNTKEKQDTLDGRPGFTERLASSVFNSAVLRMAEQARPSTSIAQGLDVITDVMNRVAERNPDEAERMRVSDDASALASKQLGPDVAVGSEEFTKVRDEFEARLNLERGIADRGIFAEAKLGMDIFMSMWGASLFPQSTERQIRAGQIQARGTLDIDLPEAEVF